MYRLARRRRPVAPVPALVTFHRLELLDQRGQDVEFEAEVSAGTYLRAFAHDLGQALGCGGHLYTLHRTAIGPFRVDAALSVPALAEAGPRLAEALIAMDTIPLGLPTLVLTQAGIHAIRHGRPCGIHDVSSPRPPLPVGRCRLQDREGGLVGIGEVLLASVAAPRAVVRPQIVFR
jgi:tRNA pseudouridine55 synthase